jgi:putative transposase
MDFVADGLADGRRIRCLNIVDDFSQECLAIEVDSSLTGRRVIETMNRLSALRGLPSQLPRIIGPSLQGNYWMNGRITKEFI